MNIDLSVGLSSLSSKNPIVIYSSFVGQAKPGPLTLATDTLMSLCIFLLEHGGYCQIYDVLR